MDILRKVAAFLRRDRTRAAEPSTDTRNQEESSQLPGPRGSSELYRCPECETTYVSSEMENCSECQTPVEAVPDEQELGMG